MEGIDYDWGPHWVDSRGEKVQWGMRVEDHSIVHVQYGVGAQEANGALVVLDLRGKERLVAEPILDAGAKISAPREGKKSGDAASISPLRQAPR